jgi:hypothetical protein
MAGLGYRTFTAGAVLTAAQVQGYLQDQVVMDFASDAARTAALASPSQGMISYLTDSNSYWQYYETYNAGTNPGGASVAGWYPREGTVLFSGKRNNTSLSIATTTYVVASFNTFSCAGSTSNADTIQINSATVPSTFTVRKAGWYSLGMATTEQNFSSTAGTLRRITVNRNSTTGTTNMFIIQGSGTVGTNPITGSTTVQLDAGDVVRFFIYQDSGSTLTNNNINANIVYLRPASV